MLEHRHFTSELFHSVNRPPSPPPWGGQVGESGGHVWAPRPAVRAVCLSPAGGVEVFRCFLATHRGGSVRLTLGVGVCGNAWHRTGRPPSARDRWCGIANTLRLITQGDGACRLDAGRHLWRPPGALKRSRLTERTERSFRTGMPRQTTLATVNRQVNTLPERRRRRNIDCRQRANMARTNVEQHLSRWVLNCSGRTERTITVFLQT